MFNFFPLICSLCAFSTIISAKEDLKEVSLDFYLHRHGFYLSPVHSEINKGYSSEAQRQSFKKDLASLPQVKTIAEIGFDAGHSCEAFLESSRTIKVTSFDINRHPYTKVGVEFMKQKYHGRFEFIEGDSAETVNRYADLTGKKFDLIFIDGCHDFNTELNDIRNCQRLAHIGTLVWIDNYHCYGGVKNLVDYCVSEGLIDRIEAKYISDKSGVRYWAKTKYNFNTEQFFTNVYDSGIWGRDKEGNLLSGPGSLLKEGWPFINYVQNFLNTHETQSVLDLGCGDWVLASKINFGGRKYIGIDVVESLVKRNQSLYGSETIQFLKLDAGVDPLPAADLLICKDVLMHLPYSYIFQILSESKKFKYCIFINDIDPKTTINQDLTNFGFRCLNLTQPPFNLIPFKTDTYVSGNAIKEILLIKN